MERNPDAAARDDTSAPVGRTAFLLTQLGTHAARRFAERVSELDLTPPHVGILRIVGQTPGLSQRQVADNLGLPPSRLVAIIDDLEKQQLLVRQPNPDDRRNHALALTAKGKRVLATIGGVAQEHGLEVLDTLDDDERRELHRLLERVAASCGLIPDVHPGYRALKRS